MAPKNKTPEQTRKLLREAREELDKAQQPLLEQLARCTGPETPWMMAAAGRDDAAVAHAERGAQRAELLERRGDRVAAALGAGWLASARLRRGEFAECLPALLTAMRGLQHVLGPSHAQVGALMAEAAFAKFESCADDDRSRDDATAPLLSVAANVWAAQGTTSLTSCVFWPFASQPPDDAVDAGPDAEEGGGHEDDDAAAVYLGRGRFCAALGAAGETLARSTTPRDRAAAWIAAGRALVGMARYVEAEEAFRNAAVARGGLTANTSPFGAVAVEAAETLEMDDDEEEESPRPPRAWQPPPRRLACAAAALAAERCALEAPVRARAFEVVGVDVIKQVVGAALDHGGAKTLCLGVTTVPLLRAAALHAKGAVVVATPHGAALDLVAICAARKAAKAAPDAFDVVLAPAERCRADVDGLDRDAARVVLVDPRLFGGALLNRRLVPQLTALRRARLVEPGATYVPGQARLVVAAVAISSPSHDARGEKLTLNAFDAAVARGLRDDPRAVEVDLSAVKMKWLSPPVVAVSLELSETLTEQDVVLDLPCDAFDDGRPAVAGGALVALVCWPEIGPFSSETITRALPKSLPHAWTPLPRATAAGLRDGVHCTYTAAGVAFTLARRPGASFLANALSLRWGRAAAVRDAPTASAFREAVDVAVPEAAERAQRRGESALVLVVGGDLAAVLALLAARAAAGRAVRATVLLMARDARLAAVARRLVAENGVDGAVGVHVEVRVGDAGRDAASVLRGRRADLLIMDPFDDRGALRRDTRAVAAACWRGALRFDAKVVPRRCRVRCCLVTDAGANGDWARYGLPTLGARLTEAVDVADDDLCDRAAVLADDESLAAPRKVELSVARSGVAAAACVWAVVHCGAGICLTTALDGLGIDVAAATHVASRRPVDLRILAPRRCVKNGVERLAVSSGRFAWTDSSQTAPADAVWRVLRARHDSRRREFVRAAAEESPRGASHCDAVYALERDPEYLAGHAVAYEAAAALAAELSAPRPNFDLVGADVEAPPEATAQDWGCSGAPPIPIIGGDSCAIN